MKRRYPLDTLQDVRRQAVDERAREVSEQVERTERADAQAKRSVAVRRAEAERSRRVAASEHARVEEGAARAADLAALGAWRVGAALREHTLEEAESAARGQLALERTAEARARAALSDADADAKAVEKHRARWDAERAAREERAEEDAAAEVWSGRKRGPA